jgi:hypothetical protein
MQDDMNRVPGFHLFDLEPGVAGAPGALYKG